MTAPMVAQADATLYGSFRMSLMQADGADLDLRDEATRIGIKGDVDLGMGDTKGLFLWEAGVNTVDSDEAFGNSLKNRLGYMGLSGSWGTTLVGRQYHPHYTMVNSHTNIFQGATPDHGEAFALGNVNHKRAGNTLAYASPVMSGFQVVGGLVIAGDGDDDNNNFDDDVDGYNIGAQFTGVEGLRVSAAYGDVDAEITGVGSYESELWGLGATYNIGDFTVAAKYEDREDSYNTDSAEFKVWELAGVYQMGATAFKARYGKIDLDIDGWGVNESDDGRQWGLEVEHKLGNRGFVWVGYTDFNEAGAAMAKLSQTKQGDVAAAAAQIAAGTYTGVSEDMWQIGYRLDF
jgi:predicted porin